MGATPSAETIGAYEAKTHFSALLEKVEAGQQFIITKHGTPVARLIPTKKELTAAERRKVIDDWIKRPDKPTLNGLKIRDLINEGRP